jgi:hypothetical protein
MAEEAPRLYKAMIWTEDPEQPGQRVTVVARTIDEAKDKLEVEYGKGNVYNLHNEEDANRPR